MTGLLAASDDTPPLTALDDGSGPSLLVVHPGGGDATAWDGVIRHLTDDFRVVRINWRIYTPDAEIALLDPSAFAGLLLCEPPMPTRELIAGEAAARARPSPT
ncbi:hypothetical protein ABTZ03_41085 [Kitasatospora sp. NPDC096077]|uniref:alpha/beta fold hydrolase n=1 Tax=Kitasatospora sp. NPDC096077 TaxID=3155544 RepID=UPI00332235BD